MSAAIPRIAPLLAAIVALAPVVVAAQVHVVEGGGYTVRANALPSDDLPARTATLHGIDRAADRGVLNVVVLQRRGDREVTVPADVVATRRNLIGQEQSIDMRAIEENGRVSYLGTFDFAPLQHMRFTIQATPAGSVVPLDLEFEDRLVRSRRN